MTLRVETLRKVYRSNGGNASQDLVVMDHLSFDVVEGEFVTIIGPSGCGKTTLLSMIAGIERCDGGEIIVNGVRVYSPRSDAVIVFQEDALFPWLTVSQNVCFGLRNRGIGKEEQRRLAMNYIEMMQLGQFAGSYMHQLSGGMKQRVAIARGLAANPRILLMDEPFGALDHRTREILQRQIQEIHMKTKKTILFVTHDVREAIALGDRVLLLSRRPAHVKSEYAVDFPRPRSAEDPSLDGVVRDVQADLNEEVSFTRSGEADGEETF